MHIGLVGYGKMGKEVERVALEKGWSVDVKADIMLPPPLPEARRIVDVVIHFAGAGTITEDLRPWAEAKKNIVVGTTGWSAQMPNIEALVQENGIGLIYASNFSLGVHLFYRILRTAGALFDKVRRLRCLCARNPSQRQSGQPQRYSTQHSGYAFTRRSGEKKKYSQKPRMRRSGRNSFMSVHREPELLSARIRSHSIPQQTASS